jgi:hypothetical protein
MDVSGVVGHCCDRDRGIGGYWKYGVRCGWNLLGFRMAEAFGSSQVEILANFCGCVFQFVHNGS